MYLNMKNYSDLLATDPRLNFFLKLEPVGTPEISVLIGHSIFGGGKIFKPFDIQTSIDLMTPFCIQIELKNKIYDINRETAVIVRSIKIDGIDIVPRF